MTLYEIDKAILECVDEETGEIIDFERFEELAGERDFKVENIGLWYKNLKAEAEALKTEIDVLKKRQTSAVSKMEQLEAWLCQALAGKKFSTPKIDIKFRSSEAVEVDDEFVSFAAKYGLDSFLRYKEPEPNKTALSEALKNGEEIPHASMVKRLNMNIK